MMVLKVLGKEEKQPLKKIYQNNILQNFKGNKIVKEPATPT